jgi:hypothetical protein
VAPRQQRKPAYEASPPPRRTTVPPPANDNRVRLRVLTWAGAIVAAALAAYILHRLLG